MSKGSPLFQLKNLCEVRYSSYTWTKTTYWDKVIVVADMSNQMSFIKPDIYKFKPDNFEM